MLYKLRRRPINRKAAAIYGGFSPLDLPNLKGWWDFSDISTLFQDSSKTTPVASDGDVIGAVEDKSGNGNDFLQPTTADKPLYKTSIVNGKSIARFDGVDDHLEQTGFSLATNATLFYVYRTSNWEPNTKIFAGRNTNGSTIFYFYESVANGVGKLGIYDGTTISKFGNHDDDALAHIYTHLLNNTAANAYIDGAQSGAQATIVAISWTNNNIALGFNALNQDFVEGDTAELILCSSSLPDAHRSKTRRYLASKWGIALP